MILFIFLKYTIYIGRAQGTCAKNLVHLATLFDRFLTRLVFSWFFDIRGNLNNVKEKPTRKTCFFP